MERDAPIRRTCDRRYGCRWTCTKATGQLRTTLSGAAVSRELSNQGASSSGGPPVRGARLSGDHSRL